MLATQTFECEVGGKNITIETGKLATQADGAVTVTYGETVVLVTGCIADQPREGVDFLPLTIDYEERLYAAGKIPGGFIRREGRPSQEATLTSRLTDRPLRPLLPKEWRRDIQLVITVLSADQENNPDILALIGSSAVLPQWEMSIGTVNSLALSPPTYLSTRAASPNSRCIRSTLSAIDRRSQASTTEDSSMPLLFP